MSRHIRDENDSEKLQSLPDMNKLKGEIKSE